MTTSGPPRPVAWGDGASGARWQERAVERSLRSARAKAVSRSERFIAAATELLYETGSLDFTVQELIERSGMSLRSFYQHFASKDDLLLAVFEDSIRDFVAVLRTSVDALDDPVERLRAYVTGFYEASSGSARPASRALSRYMLLLTQSETAELARVLEPQTSLLLEILEAGVATRQVRSDLPPMTLALLITQGLMAAIEMNVLGAHLLPGGASADDFWAFCTGGVLAPGAQARGQ